MIYLVWVEQFDKSYWNIPPTQIKKILPIRFVTMWDLPLSSGIVPSQQSIHPIPQLNVVLKHKNKLTRQWHT